MRALLSFALIVPWLNATAQQHWVTATEDADLPKKFHTAVKVNASDMNAVAIWAEAVRNDLVARGRLEASVDSCHLSGDTTRCAFHIGPVYKWARLSKGTLPSEIASAAHFRERFYDTRPINPRQMARLYEALLEECENNGYPFASVGLDSIRTADNGLIASIRLDRGQLARIDSVIVKGDAHISQRYLYAHIGVRPGDLYNESLVRGLDKRMRELPFITQRQAPYVLFTPEHTRIYLFLDAKKASSFNGILGVQPDPTTGKVKFTGDIDLKLRNALRHGEVIDLNWRSLQDRTQDLKVRFNYPFLLNTPFGTDLTLKLFKRDTTFLEVTSRVAIEYLFTRGDKVAAFVNSKSSQRLGQKLTSTPGLGDVNLTSYGLLLHRERFDYRFNPRQGISADIDGSVGRKRSSTATQADAATTPATNSTQYELNAQLVWHIPLGRRATLRCAAQGGSMVNPRLYRNELFRMGGLKSLRGVDEASIYCSSFAIGTLEYRFLFEENSNISLFADQAWWEDRSQSKLITDTPLGFGVGTSFETKAGIFSLSYALGRQFNNPIEFRAGKVHFGFTSLF